MDKAVSKVERIAKRILAFSSNTRKSVGKLTSSGQVKSRLDLLQELWADYQQAWELFEDVVADAEEAPAYTDGDFEQVQEEFMAARGELNAMMDEIAMRVVPVREQRDQPHRNDNDDDEGMRMKALETPTFSGLIDDWVSFRDLFTSMVVNNRRLSDVNKLQHLRMACQGEAADIIDGIPVTAANFQVAWGELTDNYENEWLLVATMIERLLNLPKMTAECPDELRRLVNDTNKILRSLGVLNMPIDQWNAWVVVLTTRKLDSNTRRAWEMSIASSTAIPTMDELTTFLRGVLRSVQASQSSSNVSTYRFSANGGSQQQSANVTGNSRRVVRTNAVISGDQNKGCFFCHGAHGLYKCAQFLGKAITERRQFVQAANLCYNCMGTTQHQSRFCPIRHHCRECQQHHHTLLHLPDEQVAVAQMPRRSNPFIDSPPAEAAIVPAASGSTVSTNVCVSTEVNPNEVLLATAWVMATAQCGRSVRLRALVDPASQWSLITVAAVERLAAKKLPTQYAIMGVGETPAGSTSMCVRLTMSGCKGEGGRLNVIAIVMPKLVSTLPNQALTREGWLGALSLADEQFEQPGPIDVLLGADAYRDLMREGVRRNEQSKLIAQQTMFGWVVTGRVAAAPSETVVHTMHVKLDDMMQRFWEQEEVVQRPTMSAEDEACEAIFRDTTVRNESGRYIVELPFRQGGRELGASRANAVRRLLAMEKRGRQYPEMFVGYRKFMETYLRLGHMERVPDSEIDNMPQCYLPHHAVFKPDSTTTKLRVVFDATAATANGVGLNALLLTGPRLQETLAYILMRWRGHRVAISADIEKMYRQILVASKHCDYQRIVWREQETDDIVHYRLKTVTYGTASAPYMAVKTLQRLADDEQQNFPQAAAVVRNDFYVDDCLSGAESVQGAIQLKDGLLGIMAAGGLRLLKWSSNSTELLQTLPADHIECQGPLRIDEDDSIKALGIHWHPAADEIGYKVHVPVTEECMSKRQVLSEIARLFDPLGLLAPVIITAKTMMQQLWLTGLGWDDLLPEDVRARWSKFQMELPLVEEVRVKRWFRFSGDVDKLQLHGFSDASEMAYAACVYARVQQADGMFAVSLLAAKTKVAPIKQQSIPRLELNGAVLLAKLLLECRQALRFEEAETIAWTDSMVVLAWLRRHANVWPTFVANRVSEIQSTMNATQWRHVPGVDNPADVASRGLMPSEISKHSLWWSGPRWLSSSHTTWPQQPQVDIDSLVEEKKVVRCQVVQAEPIYELAYKFSSWMTLVRVTAYCRRMLREQHYSRKVLEAEEVSQAKRTWIRLAQANAFGDTSALVTNDQALRKLGLQRLRPILDSHGILRVGGRLANAMLSYAEQHPAILPGKGIITQLIVKEAHERVFHGGPQHTSAQLHQQYWILQERRNVRQYVHKCVTCTKARPRRQQQLMGQLPAARVRTARAFEHTGIDYAGPIWTRTAKGRGHKAHKSWIGVFVCFVTKAVHLELVSDVSSAAFIAAYRRFTARRGLCAAVYCDNGTNFVGADREMRRQLAAAMQDAEWRTMLSGSGTVFQFAPPGSPHFNGLAEAAVKSAKTAMRKVIGENTLTFEEMSTFLAQVEAALNSRPLCAMSSDGSDDNALTPGHFLIGHPLTAMPEPSVVDEKLSLANRWHLVQQITQHFWRRWSREYLHQMQQRQKWLTPVRNVEVGDLVLIHDEVVHCTRWKMGRVMETHAGADGQVRVATIRTAGGMLKRAIVKLTVLPVEKNERGVDTR